MASVAGLAPARVGLKIRLLELLCIHGTSEKNSKQQPPTSRKDPNSETSEIDVGGTLAEHFQSSDRQRHERVIVGAACRSTFFGVLELRQSSSTPPRHHSLTVPLSGIYKSASAETSRRLTRGRRPPGPGSRFRCFCTLRAPL